MKSMLIAAAVLALSSGMALADAGGGNGGAAPPNVSATDSEGSQGAQAPSYGVSSSTPTGSATSSEHWAGQGRETKTLNGQTVTGPTATLGGQPTSSQ